MNKNLFWAGITFQGIHILAFAGYFGLSYLSKVDFSFLTQGFLMALAYILFNVFTLMMIFIGALSGDKK